MTINPNFLKMLNGLNNPAKYKAINLILSKIREQLGADHTLYENPEKCLILRNKLFDVIDITDEYLEKLIEIETKTPYSIFSLIMNDNYSDLIIHSKGIKTYDGTNYYNDLIDENLLDVYHVFMNHFCNNIMFIEETKFDTAHAILDTEYKEFRFNMMHYTLNANDKYPVIIIRKQVINHNVINPDAYISNVGASENQINYINELALNGSYIIFGQTGSGKTTMLKYMGNYKLENKRNLCIIEDTPELRIDVPISFVTNINYSIHDLFVSALRQNPSHVLIGETRTDEIVDILETALTTNVGTTIHANSFYRAIERMVFMSMKRKINPTDLINLITSSVDGFIFMEDRKVKEIWKHKKEHRFNGDILEDYEQVI